MNLFIIASFLALAISKRSGGGSAEASTYIEYDSGWHYDFGPFNTGWFYDPGPSHQNTYKSGSWSSFGQTNHNQGRSSYRQSYSYYNAGQ